jgi:hypothetical protein
MPEKYSHLTPIREDIYLYKYLTIDRFGQILADRVLNFNRADQLIEYHKGILSPGERKYLHSQYLTDEQDAEGRKEFNRTVSAFKRLCRQTYLCCWSMDLSEQLMGKYLPDGNGVAIRVSAYDLKNALNSTLEFRKPEFFQVNYIDFEEDVDRLPDGIAIFGRKKTEFEFEAEARAAILLDSKKTNPENLSIKVDPAKLIDEIIVAPNADFELQVKLLQMIEEYKLHDKASNVTFYSSKFKATTGQGALENRSSVRLSYL